MVGDGSRIHTQLLVEALRSDPGLLVVPFDLDSGHLLASFQSHAIDVLLMSSTLDGQPGRSLEVLRDLRSHIPQLRAVMLLDSSGDDAILSAFRAGARGVIARSEPLGALHNCVRHVHQGYIWANQRQMTVAIEALANAPAVRAVNAKGMSLLSQRELQIVHSLAEGLSNRDIAERLKLSPHTVKNYLFRVFDKLGVSSRVELLFMTLSGSSIQPTQRDSVPGKNGNSADELSLILKATQSGMSLPQLTLAEMYISLQKEPRDLVQAYAWYLLAANCGLHAKQQMEAAMTAKQIEQAQRQAESWLARLHALGALPETLPISKPPRSAEVSLPPLRGEKEKAKAAYSS
jgi:DNA-binding NarL/FixJ family response regulator